MDDDRRGQKEKRRGQRLESYSWPWVTRVIGYGGKKEQRWDNEKTAKRSTLRKIAFRCDTGYLGGSEYTSAFIYWDICRVIYVYLTNVRDTTLGKNFVMRCIAWISKLFLNRKSQWHTPILRIFLSIESASTDTFFFTFSVIERSLMRNDNFCFIQFAFTLWLLFSLT